MFTKKRAFTLIELIVVIAILAILAVALIPLINNFIEKSRISRIMTTASTLETAAVAFNADVAGFPEDLKASFDQSELVVDTDRAGWDGPYLNRNTEGVSPWGSQMFLFRTASLELGDLSKDEYALAVFNENIPDSSQEEVDRKSDGSLDQESGKVQYQDDDVLIISIIADAYSGDEEGGDNEVPQPRQKQASS